MPLSTAQMTTLRRAFVDVCRGYSVTSYHGKPLYLKHLGHREHLDYDDIQARFRDDALRQGAFSEVDRLADLIAKGQWSDTKEDDIAKQRRWITSLEEGKKQLMVPSMITKHEEQILLERKALHKLLYERAVALGTTAEVYAQQRLNDHYIMTNLYRDVGMTTPVLTAEELENLSDVQVQELVDVYNAASEPCSESNLRLLSVQDFFVSYYTLCGDSLTDFFGRPVAHMTYYQIRLGSAARWYRSLRESTDISKIPAEDRTSPDGLDRWHAQQRAQAAAPEGRVSNVGMTKQDIEAMGMQGKMATVPKSNASFAQLLSHVRQNTTPQ